MSNVQTSAERHPHDLSRFVFSTGSVGCLKVLETTVVQPGDSFEMDLNGVLRLSPLRRGLAVDSQCDVFTFYMPHRRSLGDVFVDFLKAGPGSGKRLPTFQHNSNLGHINFLGTHAAIPVGAGVTQPFFPLWTVRTYEAIYNNYFKNPYDADKLITGAFIDGNSRERDDGFRCANLKSIWTAPLPPNVKSTHNLPAEGAVDIMALNAAYGQLHSEQERALFAQRYRDVVEMMGGKTTYDADGRPQLLMRSKFWASGYDVDGTDSQSLGQFSGRVQQVFNHKVPRFYVPEHGCIMTLALVRFPPIHVASIDPLSGMSGITYEELAGDPSIDGNQPPVDLSTRAFFAKTFTGTIKVPYGQWHRGSVNHVDKRYSSLDGFPFYSQESVTGGESLVYCDPVQFDKVFQTTQLGHWNMQAKTNVTVLRSLPTARDSVMTS